MPEELEWKTRKERVDRKLKSLQPSWEIVKYRLGIETSSLHCHAKEYDVFSQRFRREDFDDDKPYDPKVLPGSYLTEPQPSHTFVYVSTIQRMAINLFGWEGAFAQTANDPDYEDEDAARLDIPIHAFDAIIADECHRGYTAKDTATWRAVLWTTSMPSSFTVKGGLGRARKVFTGDLEPLIEEFNYAMAA